MKKSCPIAAMIVTAIAVAAVAAAGVMLCMRLFDRKYFTVNE